MLSLVDTVLSLVWIGGSIVWLRGGVKHHHHLRVGRFSVTLLTVVSQLFATDTQEEGATGKISPTLGKRFLFCRCLNVCQRPPGRLQHQRDLPWQWQAGGEGRERLRERERVGEREGLHKTHREAFAETHTRINTLIAHARASFCSLGSLEMDIVVSSGSGGQGCHAENCSMKENEVKRLSLLL